MKTAALLVAGACTCMAAIGNFRVLGTTATQALIAYNAPDGNACTIQLSQSNSYSPAALDVDPGTFANSNSDLSRPSTVAAGLSRTLTLGQRTAQLATAGAHAGVRHYSRALQALTPVFRADYLSFDRRHACLQFHHEQYPTRANIRRSVAFRSCAPR